MKPDYELDRDIQSILSVDPSPEFIAKVRRRIEDAPAPESRFEWMIFAVTAMAAGIAIAIVTSVPHESLQTALPEPAPGISMRAAIPNDSGVKAVPPVSNPAASHLSRIPTESTAPTATLAAKSNDPEFFISAGEAAAIRRLLRTGSVEQVEIAIETIEPQPLPERMTPISLFEPIPSEPLLAVATPKGDSQ